MNPFMNMDHELRDALRRKQAPADLAERVLARINEQPAVRQAAPASSRLRQGYGGQGFGSQGVRRWLAAAAVLAVTVGGAERYYTQQRAAEAARVQQELRIALQITSDTLAVVQSKLSPPAEDGGR
jgi:SOS response regulatory protein OraA/RecX